MHRVTDKGDIRVQYEGCNNRWTFYPGALIKMTNNDAFSVGDMVKVKMDLNAVKQYQIGHGEWADVMKSVTILFLNELLLKDYVFFRFLRQIILSLMALIIYYQYVI